MLLALTHDFTSFGFAASAFGTEVELRSS